MKNLKTFEEINEGFFDTMKNFFTGGSTPSTAPKPTPAAIYPDSAVPNSPAESQKQLKMGELSARDFVTNDPSLTTLREFIIRTYDAISKASPDYKTLDAKKMSERLYFDSGDLLRIYVIAHYIAKGVSKITPEELKKELAANGISDKEFFGVARAKQTLQQSI